MTFHCPTSGLLVDASLVVPLEKHNTMLCFTNNNELPFNGRFALLEMFKSRVSKLLWLAEKNSRTEYNF